MLDLLLLSTAGGRVGKQAGWLAGLQALVTQEWFAVIGEPVLPRSDKTSAATAGPVEKGGGPGWADGCGRRDRDAAGSLGDYTSRC